jgi:hypothetical protein
MRLTRLYGCYRSVQPSNVVAGCFDTLAELDASSGRRGSCHAQFLRFLSRFRESFDVPLKVFKLRAYLSGFDEIFGPCLQLV